MLEYTGFVIKRNASRQRLAARKAGIEIKDPEPHLPVAEQEETDTM